MASKEFSSSFTTEPDSKPGVNNKCEPCNLRGNAEEAVGLCKVCDELLCNSCLTVHLSSKASKDHEIQYDSEKLVNSGNPTHYCDVHKESQVEFFCSAHDNVFCRLCCKLKHSECQSVKTIADVCSGSIQQYQNHFIEISILCKLFKDLKSQRRADVEKLETQGQNCQDSVRNLRAEMNKLFDRLENEITDKISAVVENEKGIVNDQLSNIDSAIDSLESSAKNLTEAKNRGSDQGVFICMKKSALNEVKAFCRLIQQVRQVELKFEEDVSLRKLVDSLQSLGQLKVDTGPRLDHSRGYNSQDPIVPVHQHEPQFPPHYSPQGSGGGQATGNVDVMPSAPPLYQPGRDFSVPNQRQYPVGGRTNAIPGHYKDRKIVKVGQVYITDSDNHCGISCCATLPSGEVLMCDYTNKKLKMTDASITGLHSCMKLKSRPFDVAVTHPTAVVVTLPEAKKLQFVTAKPWLQPGWTVNTGRKCFGTACCNGKIIVGCKDKQGGDVLVLNHLGELQKILRVCGEECGPVFLSHYMAFGSTEEHMFVSHRGPDIVTCYKTEQGYMSSVFTKGISKPCGILADTEDNLYVCNWEHNTINVVNKDGSSYRTLLTNLEGVERPYSICFRAFDSTLIVGGCSDTLKVFQFQ